jgi:uncharacterized protein (DUF488 family)
MVTSPVLWTIGHSNHEFGDFVRLLEQQDIGFVVDVRSYPYSRHAPQFNHEELQRRLGGHGIGYLFLGEELGGRPSRDEHYDADGHALYGAMAREPAFSVAIDRLLDGAKKNHRIALVCSEGDPRHCHRRLLIGKVLTDSGAELRHIQRDGDVVVERSVELEPGSPTLFGKDAQAWRSTQSVSRRRRLSTSSAG